MKNIKNHSIIVHIGKKIFRTAVVFSVRRRCNPVSAFLSLISSSWGRFLFKSTMNHPTHWPTAALRVHSYELQKTHGEKKSLCTRVHTFQMCHDKKAIQIVDERNAKLENRGLLDTLVRKLFIYSFKKQLKRNIKSL